MASRNQTRIPYKRATSSPGTDPSYITNEEGIDTSDISPRASNTDAEADQYLYNHPLEQQILREYRTLSCNLTVLSAKLSELSTTTEVAAASVLRPDTKQTANAVAIAEGLRQLERKTATACTALKSSVYGIVLQQQIEGEGSDRDKGLGDDKEEYGGGWWVHEVSIAEKEK